MDPIFDPVMNGVWIGPRFGSFETPLYLLILLLRDKEVLTAERAVERQKMEENLVDNKMNVILDSGLFSKVLSTMMKTIFTA